MTGKTVTNKYKPTIAIDFDGVIHKHESAWVNATTIQDPPHDGAFDFIRALVADGYDVVIHTARMNDHAASWAIRDWLRAHALEEWIVETIKITALKPAALLYIDDRGWRFEGRFPDLSEVKSIIDRTKRPAPRAVGVKEEEAGLVRTRWGHSGSKDPEQWDGSFETREEAIADGRQHHGDNAFYVCWGTVPYVGDLLPKAEEVLDLMRDRAFDASGVAAEAAGFPAVTSFAESELDVLLCLWAEKHVKVDFWVDGGEAERIEPPKKEEA